MRGKFYSSGLLVLSICVIMGLLGYMLRGVPGLNQVTLYLILGIYAMSVDFLWGYSGLLSFGQAVFFGMGAFGYAWFRMDMFGLLPFIENASLLGVLAAIIVPVLLSLFIGYFLFYGKIAGASFTVVTLAMSFLLSMLALGWRAVFGGYTGFPRVSSFELNIGSISLKASGGLSDYLVITLICVCVAILLQVIVQLPFGKIVDGLRDNEQRLELLGVSTPKVKLLVFIIAAAIAGLSGGLFVSHTNYVSYDLLGVVLSTEAVIWVAVGGRKTIAGGFLGAVVVRTMSYFLSGIAIAYWMIFIGALFIIIVLFGSDGIIGIVKNAFERRVQRAT